MVKFIKGTFLVYCSLPLLFACGREKVEPTSEVSHIPVEVSIKRFEQDLFALPTPLKDEHLNQLESKYPVFFDLFVDKVLGMEGQLQSESDRIGFIEGFITFPALLELKESVDATHGDFAKVEQDFRSAFQFYKYYFPDAEIPSVTTYISEYNVAAFIYGDNQLAVGLDFFLGADYPYREKNPNNPSFSDYLTQSFTKDHLVAKTIAALVNDIVGEGPNNNLLEMMIQEGKKLFLMSKLLPMVNDTVIMEVGQAEWNWLEENEFNIWAFFLEEELLYDSEWRKIRKYIEYSPHSPGMPDEAPGRTGAYIGWKIIEQYFQKHPQIGLKEIFKTKDAQLILSESRYRPVRQ